MAVVGKYKIGGDVEAESWRSWRWGNVDII